MVSYRAGQSAYAFSLRLEVCSALRASASLRIHVEHFRWMDLMAALCAGHKQGSVYLIKAHFGATGHAPFYTLGEQKANLLESAVMAVQQRSQELAA